MLGGCGGLETHRVLLTLQAGMGGQWVSCCLLQSYCCQGPGRFSFPPALPLLALNAHTFLRNGGHFLISIKANCIDSTASAEAVFASEVRKLQQENLKPQEQLTLEPYERDHAVVVGVYRPLPKSSGK